MDWMVAGLATAGILAGVIGALVFVLVLVLGVVWLVRRRSRSRIDPAARREALENLGYTSAGEGRWSVKVEDTSLVFEDGPRGWRWVVRLPRYNTMSLQVDERTAVDPATVRGAFDSGIPELDERFVCSSTLAARTLPLVANRAVADAMIALPYLSLRLGADELVLEDPQLHNLARLSGATTIGTPSALAAESEIHQLVLVLVNQMFGCLYSRFTGTIMPDFR